MLQKPVLGVFLAVFGIVSAAFVHSHADGFTHAVYLDPNNTVLLKWSIASSSSNATAKLDVLEAELTAPTRGYMAFGVSPNGGMVGANMLVMWVDTSTGRAHVQDRYATAFAEPFVNDDQTAAVIALEGHENATHTIVKFSRWLDAGCSSTHDLSITESVVRVIYAYGEEDPDVGGHIKYHGTENRGSQSLYLIDDVSGDVERNRAAALAETSRTITYTAKNFSVPAVDTYYRCEMFEVPEIEEDLQIVGFEPILQHNNLDILHHFIVHDCEINRPLKLKSFECYNTPPELVGEDVMSCFGSIVWAWAVSGTATYLPRNISIPFKPNSKNSTTKRYMLMEMHYNNPAVAANRVDSSGFRMLLTNKLRPTRASTWTISSFVDVTMTIPGSTPMFTVPALCTQQCTQKYLPAQGATVFNVLLHSHLLGRSLALRHFRKGVELPAIASDQSYDFNYQQWRPTNVTILPGDHFIMECNYSSTTPELRKNSTIGGFSSREEMCAAVIMATPEVDVKICMSQVSYENIETVLKFDDIPAPSRNATFDEMTKYRRAVNDRVKSIDWSVNEPMKTQLIDLYLHKPHKWACGDGQSYMAGVDQLMPSWTPFSPQGECRN